jgi:transcriptional regulator with XRE-family HTH domain
MTEKNTLGNRIRQLREGKRLSIESLAEKSQVHKKLIEELENGELVSSIAPLLKIARGLGVRISALVDDAPTTDAVVVRGGHSETAVEFSGLGSYCLSTLDFRPMAKNKKDRHMEPFIVDVHPSVPEDVTLSFHEGEEFIYVLSGEIEILHGNDRHVLSPGDSIYYDSTTPHQVQALGEKEAKILAVIYA